jgi:transposase
VAVIGDITRFPSPRHLVGYLGLDPRVRQSGEKNARHGHISREEQAHARGLLVEAAHTAIRTPGPLHAFHARLTPRRGKQIALCATARKLAVLVWHLLSKNEDYAFAAPTITQRKLRTLQRQAGDTGPRISLAGETNRKTLEQRFLEEAERNYQNYVAFKARRNRGAGAATGDTTVEAVKAANDARQAPQSPDACSSRSGSPAPKEILAPSP